MAETKTSETRIRWGQISVAQTTLKLFKDYCKEQDEEMRIAADDILLFIIKHRIPLKSLTDMMDKNLTKEVVRYHNHTVSYLKEYEKKQIELMKILIKTMGGNVPEDMFKILENTTDTSENTPNNSLKSQYKPAVESSNQSPKQEQIVKENVVKNADSSKQNETLKGRIGSDIEFTDVTTKEKGEKKQVATFSLADNSKGKETVWHNVHMWEDKFPKNLNDIKKGDIVELKGYNKTFEVKTGEGKTNTEFVATEVVSHQAKKSMADIIKEKERITLKGTIGQDTVIKNVNDKHTVAAFLIAVKQDGSEKPYWQQVQVWNEGIEKNKIADLKKGDFVELRGYLGNEYKNSKQEIKQDLILEECRVLKQANVD